MNSSGNCLMTMKYHKEYDMSNPAIYKDGKCRWLQNSQLHRIDGPEVKRPDGTREWYCNGQLHGTDGPAIITQGGTHRWYQNDERHRTDGPEVKRPDGQGRYFVHGHEYNIYDFVCVV